MKWVTRGGWYSRLKNLAVLKGLVATIIGNIFWAISIVHEETYAIAVFVQYMTPFIASFISIYFDSRRPIFKSIVLGFVSAFVVGTVSLVFDVLGLGADFHGLGGALLVMALSLPVCLLSAIIGAIAGRALKQLI